MRQVLLPRGAGGGKPRAPRIAHRQGGQGCKRVVDFGFVLHQQGALGGPGRYIGGQQEAQLIALELTCGQMKLPGLASCRQIDGVHVLDAVARRNRGHDRGDGRQAHDHEDEAEQRSKLEPDRATHMSTFRRQRSH